MKLKQMVFATLFGLAMVGQFLVPPAFSEIPTKNKWLTASGNMNLKPKTVEKIGAAFEKYYAVINEVTRNRQRIPDDPNNPDGKALTVFDNQAKIDAASKLKCKLNSFITQLQKSKNRNNYQAAISYLVDRASDVALEEEKFAKAQRIQEEELAARRGVPNPSFDEAETVRDVATLIDNARAKFSNIEQNPNNIDAFYRGDIRAITIAINPLKRNKPQTYTTMVDAFNTKAAEINTELNSGTADRLKLVAKAKGAILNLYAALETVRR